LASPSRRPARDGDDDVDQNLFFYPLSLSLCGFHLKKKTSGFKREGEERGYRGERERVRCVVELHRKKSKSKQLTFDRQNRKTQQLPPKKKKESKLIIQRKKKNVSLKNFVDYLVALSRNRDCLKEKKKKEKHFVVEKKNSEFF
jgi:hypothetical protein